MAYLTKSLSDILCTIIAVGFMAIQEQKHQTIFVYEKEEDKPKHDQLEQKLRSYGINIKFHLATPQNVRPFIIGQTKYIYGDKPIQDVEDDFKRNTDSIQNAFNHSVLINTPGAYIGCYIDLNKIEFNSPSELYLYDPVYRNPDELESVESSYKRACEVTDALISFLKTNLPSIDKKLRCSLRLNNHKPEPEYQQKKLFASCHGMVLAIYDYGNHLAKDGVCAELALGKDTTKVASCLPCSLFMSANEYPASATHLGRGDNWHWSLDKEEHIQTRKWRTAVNEAYQMGLTKTGNIGLRFSNILPTLLKNVDHLEIELPNLFLEALTFESSFLDKINSVL